jgi:hypothetical protein
MQAAVVCFSLPPNLGSFVAWLFGTLFSVSWPQQHEDLFVSQDFLCQNWCIWENHHRAADLCLVQRRVRFLGILWHILISKIIKQIML